MYYKNPTKQQLENLKKAVAKIGKFQTRSLLLNYNDESYKTNLLIWYTNNLIWFHTAFISESASKIQKSNFNFITTLREIENFLYDIGFLVSKTNNLIEKCNEVKTLFYKDEINILSKNKLFDESNFNSFTNAAISYYNEFFYKFTKQNIYYSTKKDIKIQDLIDLKRIINVLKNENAQITVPDILNIVISSAFKLVEKNVSGETVIPFVSTYADKITYTLASKGINPFVETPGDLLSLVMKEYNKVSNDMFEDIVENETKHYHKILKNWLADSGHLYEIEVPQPPHKKESFDLGNYINKIKESELKIIKNDDPVDVKYMTKTIVIYKSEIELNKEIFFKSGKVPQKSQIYGINDNKDVVFITYRYPYVENANDIIYDEIMLSFVKHGTGKPTINDEKFKVENIIGTTSILKIENCLVAGKPKRNYYGFYTIYGKLINKN